MCVCVCARTHAHTNEEGVLDPVTWLREVFLRHLTQVLGTKLQSSKQQCELPTAELSPATTQQ